MKAETQIKTGTGFTLDVIQEARKEVLERRIREGIATFRDIGEALLEIKTAKLYVDEYDTFIQYVRAKWNIGSRRAYYLIDAADIAAEVEDILEIPNEAVAREVAKADPGERREVARELAKVAEEKPITAPIAREVVEQVAAKSEQMCTNGEADPGEEKKPEPPADRPEKPLSIPDKYKPVVVMMIERWYAREAHQLNSMPVAVPETVTRRILALFK